MLHHLAIGGFEHAGREGATKILMSASDPKVVCSPESGPLFELVPASDMELNYGQETEA